MANMLEDTQDPEALAEIARQMQQGLDAIQLNELLDKNRRSLNERKHGLFASRGIRGLDLSRGKERGINMSFDKTTVPERNELNVSYDRSEAPTNGRVPIGSRRGRSLTISFDKRSLNG